MTEEQEFEIFKRVNEKHWQFQNWNKSESPDFLVSYDDKVIGIEISEVIKKNIGELIASKLSLEDQLASIITDQLNKSSMDLNLSGMIDFKTEISISSNQKEYFCHRVSSAIISHSKSLIKESWSINHCIEHYIPEEINWISYDCYPFMDESRFYATRGKTQEFLKEEDVIETVLKKEAKYQQYLRKCDEVYLLLIEGLIPASWIGKLKKPINYLHSSFDKVYLFHSADSELIELK